MDERNCQNLRVIENSQETREEEVSEQIKALKALAEMAASYGCL